MKKLFILLSAILVNLSVNAQCNEPSNIRIENYLSYINIVWDTNGADHWDLEYGVSGFTPTGVPTTTNTSSHTRDTQSLPLNTTLDFYVRANCSSTTSDWVGPLTFYNYCLDNIWESTGWVEEDFNNDFIPSCWIEANEGAPNSSIGGFENSAWEQVNFANNATNSLSAKISISETSTNDWLVLPPMIGIHLGKITEFEDLNINFNIALTQSNTNDAATLGSDDIIKLVISPDLGATWYNIRTWDKDTGISNIGEEVSIVYPNNTDGFDLYEKVFLVAFWASSGTVDDGINLDFFVDDINAYPPMEGAVGDLESKGFTVFPNPSKSLMNLSAKETIERIWLINQVGQELKHQKIDKMQSQFDISDLPKGIYYLKVQIGDVIGTIPVLVD